jgi:hypothetical protein
MFGAITSAAAIDIAAAEVTAIDSKLTRAGSPFFIEVSNIRMAGAPYLSALFPDHSRFYGRRNRTSEHHASDKKVRNLSSR